MFKTIFKSTSSKTPAILAVLLFALVVSVGVVSTKSLQTNNFVQVSEDSVVDSTLNSENTITKAEQFAQIVNTSKPAYALNFMTVSFVIFLSIIGVSLWFVNSNLLGLFSLFFDSLFYTKRKNGGVIFDSKTGLPIALASVKILRKNATSDNLVAEVVETVLTDLEGRYKIKTIPSRNFSIEVKVLGYASSIKTLSSNLDISLTPFKELTLLKRLLSADKYNLFLLLRFIGVLCAAWGYIVTIFAEVALPNILNILLIAIYSVLFILAVYPKLYSLFLKNLKVVDTNGKSVMAAVVRIYLAKDLVDFAPTNKNGVVRFNLVEGIYNSVTTKSGYSYNEFQLEVGEDSRALSGIVLTESNQSESINSDLDLQDQVIQNNHEKFNLH